jgi:hypothetical protein
MQNSLDMREDVMVTIERLHQLVDELPERERERAARLLEALAGLEPGEPFYTIETAPLDDEPESEAERLAVAEARAELARGEGQPADEVFRRLGL